MLESVKPVATTLRLPPAKDEPLSGRRGPVVGVGEMADRTRSRDWGATSLGPICSWSEALACSVNLMLSCRFPAVIFWGKELIQFYNDAYLPLMAEKHPAALGQPARECWEEAWHIIGPQFEAAYSTGETTYKENVLVPIVRNGRLQEVYWTYSYSPIYELSSEIAGILIVCHDVNGQVLSMRNLREHEVQAEHILQSIGDAVIVTDARGLVTRMNPVAESLTGWSAAEAQGQVLADVFRIVNEKTGQVLESSADKIKRLEKVIGLPGHTVLLSRTGGAIEIDDSAAPIYNENGELAGIVLIFRGIAERRAAERERDAIQEDLRRSEERVRLALSSTNIVGTWDWDVPADRLCADAEFAQAFGVDVLWAAAGAPFEEYLRKIHPEDREKTRETILNALRAGTEFIVEFRLLLPDGSVQWLSAQARCWLGPDGAPLRAPGIALDITARKQADEALLRTEKLAAVGRLAASIAHEINNPLESVTNLLYLISANENLGPDVRDYVETAERELRRVSAISNQTLRFHKQSTRPTAVTCEELVGGILTLYQARIVNSRVQVEKRKHAATPVLCFEGEIRQVLNNLIGNAIDAMHTLGGRLLLRSREATHWSTGRKGLVLTVADTGVGIGPDVKRKIFDAFFTTKGIGGTGLGLWVCKEIIDRHHGALNVRSSQEKGRSGTVFTLFLPFEAANRQASTSL
ncbi:MAG: PAS domain S-box protein [Janthinobacterium lividum]